MAITYGMSTTEFWDNEPDLLWAYHKSFMDKMKIKRETENFNFWLQGLYIYDGVSKAIYNSFGRKSGQITQEYPKQPYILYDSSEEKEEKQILEKEEKIKARNKEIAEMLKRQKNKE